jgi:hypothetical protein
MALRAKVDSSDGSYEEVEFFDVEVDLDEIEGLNELLTEVKLSGRLDAASNLMFDCSDPQWIRMQIAYDRGLRRFSCRGSSELIELSSFVPDDANCCYYGDLNSKSIRRLLKLTNLDSIVVNGVDDVQALEAAFEDERDRMDSKRLGKVSPSRERFLQSQDNDGGSKKSKASKQRESPSAKNMARRIEAFLRVSSSDSADEVTQKLIEINEGGSGIRVVGLWADGYDCLDLFRSVRDASNMKQLRMALPFDNKTEKMYLTLESDEQRAFIWTFEFDYEYED